MSAAKLFYRILLVVFTFIGVIGGAMNYFLFHFYNKGSLEEGLLSLLIGFLSFQLFLNEGND
jgi:hypothetical protein